MRINTIVSGGQTGVDRAALDAALALDIHCGGWCPKGRRAEDGFISTIYPLRETPKKDYAQRTEWNVRDSDATIILSRGKPTGGTRMALQFARAHIKPCYIIDLDHETDIHALHAWMREHQVLVLNIAGPRESQAPGIYRQVMVLLLEIFAEES